MLQPLVIEVCVCMCVCVSRLAVGWLSVSCAHVAEMQLVLWIYLSGLALDLVPAYLSVASDPSRLASSMGRC